MVHLKMDRKYFYRLFRNVVNACQQEIGKLLIENCKLQKINFLLLIPLKLKSSETFAEVVKEELAAL